MYQEVWTAADGEELVCEREPHDSHNNYAVAVKRMGDHHRSLATEAIKTVFTVLETRWFYLLYGIRRKKILP